MKNDVFILGDINYQSNEGKFSITKAFSICFYTQTKNEMIYSKDLVCEPLENTLRFYKEGPYKPKTEKEVRYKKINDLSREDKIYMIENLFECKVKLREW